MKKLNIPVPTWIRTNEQLAEQCFTWLQAPYLAVDTEFIRTRTFYPEAGLLQVADAQGSYLIDPLLIDDWQPLVQVLTHPLVVKVFHACPEDLEVCRRLMGVFPEPMADTQLAAAYAGLGSSLSYQSLLEQTLNIHLPKEETRSDWLQRPLSEKQITYATADVHYLHKVYPKLMQQLKQLEREHWLVEDCERIIKQALEAEKPDNYYPRIKQSWRLREQELFLLKQLSLWREKQARLENMPRNHVVDSQTLWNMARFKTATKDAMFKAGMRGQEWQAYGPELMELVKQVLRIDASAWPKPLNKPLPVEVAFQLKDVKKLVKARAEQLQISADLLANKKSLEALMRSGMKQQDYRLPPLLQGWRKAEIGQQLLSFLQSSNSYV